MEAQQVGDNAQMGVVVVEQVDERPRGRSHDDENTNGEDGGGLDNLFDL